MSKSIYCSDLYVGCGFISRGSRDDEVLAIALHHAQMQHGLAQVDWTTLAKFTEAIRQDSKTNQK